MQFRGEVHSVEDWMQDFFFLAVGAAGVILILLGLKRDDVVRPIFLVVGLGLAVFGFGLQFLGWEL